MVPLLLRLRFQFLRGLLLLYYFDTDTAICTAATNDCFHCSCSLSCCCQCSRGTATSATATAKLFRPLLR